MTWTEAVGVLGTLISGLLTLVLALVAVIYRNDQKQYETAKTDIMTRITALEKQNTEQETRIATLVANATNHGSTMDRLADAVERLDEKVDAFTRVMGQVVTAIGRGYTTPPGGSKLGG